MCQARIKLEVFANFKPKPEPDPKSPARLTTLVRVHPEIYNNE